jgi:putative ATP-dependent endonuclease of OLD family
MKIKQIKIKNFRSIKDETIDFPDSGILSLVGPNNAGKSNILRAIDNILGDSWFSGDKAELNDHFMKNKENIIEIEIIFDDNKKVEFRSDDNWAKYYQANGNKMPFGSNIKDDFPCTYLSANRDLAKNMQFRSYELMGKIAKAFNDKIKDDAKTELNQKFDEIMKILDTIKEFSNFKKDFSNYFDDLQSDSPYKLKVDFKAFSPLNYFKTINILANDSSVNDDFDIDPVELGEGNKSLMLFALIRSYAKNFKQEATGILAIEEPEIYLHPQARRHLYQTFKEIVKDSNIQIIYTTHSPDFLSTEEFSSIGLVSKDSQEGTKVKIVTEQDLVDFSTSSGVSSDKTNITNIKEFYATTSDTKLNEGFFAKHLILVEGDTEELCLPLLFERLGLKYYSSGISIIGVEGKNQIPKYWRLFKSFGIKLSVVFDSDSDGNKNLASCLGCDESDLQGNIDKIKKVKTTNQNLYVFEKNFETALKKDFNDDAKWTQYENEAKEEIKPRPNTQKGQIARFICKIILEDQSYKPLFLQELVDEIQNKELIKTQTDFDNDDLPFLTKNYDPYI